MEPASGIAFTGVTGVATKSADIATAKTLLSNFIVFLPGSAFRLLLEWQFERETHQSPFRSICGPPKPRVNGRVALALR
jgi:hypothetical protein